MMKATVVGFVGGMMVALIHSVPEEQQGHGRLEKYDEAEDRLVLERRIFGRRRIHAMADARRFDHSIAARRQPRVKLQLLDVSVGGLSAVCDMPLEAGEHLGVTFPPELGQRGWNAFGRVVRCEPAGEGYRLAVEFESLPAA